MITQELKDRLIADYPKFEDMTHKFYKKELSIADYKGQSGAYGSYAVNITYNMYISLPVNAYKCTASMVIQY